MEERLQKHRRGGGVHGGRSISGMGKIWNSKARGKQGQTSSGSSPRRGIVSDIQESISHSWLLYWSKCPRIFYSTASVLILPSVWMETEAPGCKVTHPLINAKAELSAGVNLLLIPPPKIPQLPGAGDCSETLQAKASAGYAAHYYPGKPP